MDRQTVYSLDLWGEQKSEVSTGQESNNQVQKKLVDFILSFAVDNASSTGMLSDLLVVNVF